MLDTILSIAQSHAEDIGAGIGLFAAGWVERHLGLGARSIRLLGFAGDVLRGLASRGNEAKYAQASAPSLTEDEQAALARFAKALASKPDAVVTLTNDAAPVAVPAPAEAKA